MKLFKYIALATLAIPFASCDDISKDERYEWTDLKKIETDKVVLIEEFTGQRCVNCPKGAAAVHEMLEMIPNNLVAVSLYPKQMTDLTTPITDIDMRTDEATEYFSAYDGPSKGLPSALIDRTEFNGSMLQLTPDSWSSPVIEQFINGKTPVAITMSSDYNALTRELEVSYNLDFTDEVSEEVSFQLWIIENDIIAPQLDASAGFIFQYTHNHVLRAAINGTWGEVIGDNFKNGSTRSGSGKITLKDNWVPANCQVVGFLYRTSGRQVLQAHLLKSIEN